MVSVLHKELENKVKKLKYKKLEVVRSRIKNKSKLPVGSKKNHPRSVTQSFTVVTNTGRSRRQNACAWQMCQAITSMLCCDLHLLFMFSGVLQKDLFKGKWSLEKNNYFKQSNCHATSFCIFVPLPSCRISSPIMGGGENLKRERGLLSSFPEKGGHIIREGEGALLERGVW